MKSKIKKHWKKLIGIIGILAVLVFAYWYGGNNPESRGFKVDEHTEETENPTEDTVSEEETSGANEETLRDEAATEEAQTDDTSEDQGNEAQQESPEDTWEPLDYDYDTDAEKTEDTGGGSLETATEASSGNNSTTEENKGSSNKNSGNKNSSVKTTEASMEASAGTTEASDADTSEKATCTISIYCTTILSNISLLEPEKKSLVPSNGCILDTVTVELQVLKRVTRGKGISLEYSYTPVYGSYYIEGINNIYEFDCGELSGWMYSVNGVFPNYGCSKYVLSDGDVIRWVYTCNLGADVGNPY
jgi:hypothetical protein